MLVGVQVARRSALRARDLWRWRRLDAGMGYGHWKMAAAAAGAASLAAPSINDFAVCEGVPSLDLPDAGEPSGSAGKPSVSLDEAKRALKSRLASHRASLRAKGSAIPLISLRNDRGVLSATFQCSSRDMLKVMAALAREFVRDSDNTSERDIFEIHSTSESLDVLCFASRDKKASLVLDARDQTAPPRVTIFREAAFTLRDVEAIIAAYKAGATLSSSDRRELFAHSSDDVKSTAQKKLESLGVQLYNSPNVESSPGTEDSLLDWDSLAGYEDAKREIQDTVVMPLQHPDEYDSIARKTRARYESNRPRAVLLEGPPGTGKTLCARIIAQRCSMPMIHIGVDTVLSKWYGQSEQNIKQIWDACDSMGGAIIFVDEVDALAGTRDSGTMHEATRRVLSVILQKLEGFEGSSQSTLICATNRAQDLDAALLSRFQLAIRFNLPSKDERRAIFARYAKTLKDGEIEQLAASSQNMSCRDIKDLCEHAERRWASRLIRKEVSGSVPDLKTYSDCLTERSRGSDSSTLV